MAERARVPAGGEVVDPYSHPVSALRRILVETRIYDTLARDWFTRESAGPAAGLHPGHRQHRPRLRTVRTPSPGLGQPGGLRRVPRRARAILLDASTDDRRIREAGRIDGKRADAGVRSWVQVGRRSADDALERRQRHGGPLAHRRRNLPAVGAGHPAVERPLGTGHGSASVHHASRAAWTAAGKTSPARRCRARRESRAGCRLSGRYSAGDVRASHGFIGGRRPTTRRPSQNSAPLATSARRPDEGRAIGTRTAGSFNNEALLLKQEGKPKEAIEAFEQALVVDPNLASALWNLSDLLFAQNTSLDKSDTLLVRAFASGLPEGTRYRDWPRNRIPAQRPTGSKSQAADGCRDRQAGRAGNLAVPGPLSNGRSATAPVRCRTFSGRPASHPPTPRRSLRRALPNSASTMWRARKRASNARWPLTRISQKFESIFDLLRPEAAHEHARTAPYFAPLIGAVAATGDSHRLGVRPFQVGHVSARNRTIREGRSGVPERGPDRSFVRRRLLWPRPSLHGDETLQ